MPTSFPLATLFRQFHHIPKNILSSIIHSVYLSPFFLCDKLNFCSFHPPCSFPKKFYLLCKTEKQLDFRKKSPRCPHHLLPTTDSARNPLFPDKTKIDIRFCFVYSINVIWWYFSDSAQLPYYRIFKPIHNLFKQKRSKKWTLTVL